jgi:hypothetical protein
VRRLRSFGSLQVGHHVGAYLWRSPTGAREPRAMLS